MRVFLTGATGFLGAHTLAAMHAGGHTCAVLARPETDPWRIADLLSATTVISGSLEDTAGFATVLRDFAPDTVLNLAWSGVDSTLHNDPRQPDNLAYAEAFIDVCAAAGAKHWIGLGSQAEYGPCEHAVSESQPTRPLSAYGRAKLAVCHHAEKACARHNIRFAWLRLFSCYGPMDKETWLIPSIIRTLLAGREPELTAGLQRWDYLFAPDAAEAILRVAEQPDAQGVFNLGSGTAIPVRDIAERIRDLIDPDLPLGLGKIAYPDNPVMLLQADISRLRDATGWRPVMTLDDGLRATVDWFRAHPSAGTG